jgi:hypothetical protein
MVVNFIQIVPFRLVKKAINNHTTIICKPSQNNYVKSLLKMLAVVIMEIEIVLPD